MTKKQATERNICDADAVDNGSDPLKIWDLEFRSSVMWTCVIQYIFWISFQERTKSNRRKRMDKSKAALN